MSSPLDQPATSREVIATRAMITAIGQALVKSGKLTHADIATEMSALIQGMGADPELAAEMKHILGAIVTWGHPPTK